MAGAAPAAAPRGNSFAPTTEETDRQLPTDSLSLSVNRAPVAVVRTAHPGWRVTEHWNKVSVTSASGGDMPAIVSIRFDDAQHGVVIADTGARYNTADGGETWTQQ